MRFRLIPFSRLHCITHCNFITRHKSTHRIATPEIWRDFHSLLKSLINTLPPYPFRVPPTYSPRVDTLLGQITPILHQMTFHGEETLALISADSDNRRLLKLASFQLHRHRRALDQRNLYLGMDREKPLRDQNRVKPFTTYTREYI